MQSSTGEAHALQDYNVVPLMASLMAWLIHGCSYTVHMLCPSMYPITVMASFNVSLALLWSTLYNMITVALCCNVMLL